MLEKGIRSGYIIDGYHQMIELYNLNKGGWLKVGYAGNNEFYMSVRDIT